MPKFPQEMLLLAVLAEGSKTEVLPRESRIRNGRLRFGAALLLTREPIRVGIIEPVAPVKKRAKVAKVYEPHEHFGSPLNVCRICGEKYVYVQRPDYPIRDTKK
jgi:hypothetical protein